MTTEKIPKKRGFALIVDKDRMREIAGMGGRKAHELGHANKFTSETAKLAGAKGGRGRVPPADKT